MSGGQRRLSSERWGTVSLTMLLAVGVCPLLCGATDDFFTWCSDESEQPVVAFLQSLAS